MAFEEENLKLAQRLVRLKHEIEVIRRERKAISEEAAALQSQIELVKSKRPSEIPTRPGQTSPVFRPMSPAQVRNLCRGNKVHDLFRRPTTLITKP